MAKGGGGGFFGDNWFGDLLGSADRGLQKTGIDFGGPSKLSAPLEQDQAPPPNDYYTPQQDFGNLDYLTSPANGGGGGDVGGGVDLTGGTGGGDTGVGGGGGDTGTQGPAQPPISFGDVNTFSPNSGQAPGGGGLPGFADSSPPITSLVSGASPGGGGSQFGFGEVGGGGASFPDLTSSASGTDTGGVTQPDYKDVFNTRDQGKSQDRMESGGQFSLPQDTGDAGSGTPPPQTPPAPASPPQLSPGITPSNTGGVPITGLVGGEGGSQEAPAPQWSADGQRFLGNPDLMPGAMEQYPGQSDLKGGNAMAQAPGGTAKPAGSFMDQLMASLGKNALGATLSAGAGLFNISQANKNANTANVQGLTSTIPQVQSLIDQVGKQSRELSDQAAQLRSQGTDIVNSTQPLNDQSKRLMSYVATGTLPPEYMTQVQEGIKAAKSAAISNAAARGQNVSPGPNGDYSGNSVLQQQLQSIDRQGTILASTLAQQLYDAGVKGIGAANQTINSGTGIINAGNNTQQNSTALTQAGLTGIGLQQSVYQSLINLDTARSARVGQAISNFAQALGGGGGGGGTTIKIGPNGAPTGQQTV